MQRIGRFVKGRADLAAAFLFSVLAFTAAGEERAFWRYMDWRLLALLFCLMTVTAGLRQSGLLERGCTVFLRRCLTARRAAAFFTMAVFFSSMVITNDAALLVFVPETILFFWRQGRREWILPALIFETMAANLGSMALPMGNPQNLFLYFTYHLAPAAFLSMTVPFAGAACLLLAGGLFLYPDAAVTAKENTVPLLKKEGAAAAVLFVVVILAVLRLLPWEAALTAALVVGGLFARKALLAVDFHLLFLFAFLFVGVGNLQHLPFLSDWAASFVTGHEMTAAIVLSQVISNVPAAVLLAEYTDEAGDLVIGTNLGGLGTLIASMASLITWRLYGKVPGADKVRYIRVFTLWNILFLGILWGMAILMQQL